MTKDELIDALDHTYASIVDVARTFEADDWDRPTDCPGWSVKDHLSHLVGMERVLVGEPESDHVIPDGLAHVRNEMGAYMEAPVDERRSRSGAEVLAELEAVVARRLRDLRALDDAGWEADAIGLMGATTSPKQFLPTIVFDRWVHEQDVRRATGKPGNLDGPGARVAMDRSARALPAVLPRKVGEPDGTRVDLVTPDLTVSVTWGDTPVDAPTATVTTDTETFLRLCTGRIDPAAATVAIDGDADLGRRIVADLAFTP
jgi:uncharacterized protein (TIGR03083 family)